MEHGDVLPRKIKYRPGFFYEGGFQNGMPHGKGNLTYPDGTFEEVPASTSWGPDNKKIHGFESRKIFLIIIG